MRATGGLLGKGAGGVLLGGRTFLGGSARRRRAGVLVAVGSVGSLGRKRSGAWGVRPGGASGISVR